MSNLVSTSRNVQLTTVKPDPLLDLPPWAGQRQASFQFVRTNAVNGNYLGTITPLRNTPATLSHDTTRLIKRQLNLSLGAADTAAINPISDRISVYMNFPGGKSYPLGRYMFTDETLNQFTSGNLADVVLNDEMYTVDQTMVTGVNAVPSVRDTMVALLAGTNTVINLPNSSYTLGNIAWAAGTSRGQAIEDAATQGDFFSPWFSNDTTMHFIPAFDPGAVVPDFNWDTSSVVLRAGISKTSNLLNAPNRFLVVSNGANASSINAVATVPATAPHSFENRGFYITQQYTTQATDGGQVAAIALNYAYQQTLVETLTVSTIPDPRHDSYNVIVFQGSQWLELAWSLTCLDGGAMSHTLRKTYSGSPNVTSI